MIYKASQNTVNTYFSRHGFISNSLLKSFINGYDYYLSTKRKMEEQDIPDKYYDEPKDHFLIGSALDVKMTHVESDFDAMYYISRLSEKPSDTEISILKYVYDERIKQIPMGEGITAVSMGNFLDHTSLMEQAFAYHNYQSRWGFTAKKNAFDNVKISTYWNEMFASSGRQILTLENMVLINSMAERLKDCSFTSYLFDPNNSNIDIFCQVPIYRTINGINYKILIDMVVVDYHHRTIKLYDLKTMQDGVILFPYDYRKRRYDIQGGFYYFVSSYDGQLKDYLVSNYNLTAGKRQIINASNIADFCFLVVSKSFPSSYPLIYSMGMEKINEALEGRKLIYTHGVDTNGSIVDKTIPAVPGIKQLIAELNDSINYGYDSRHNGGVIYMSES